MGHETKTAVYDGQLGIEAYRLTGTRQSFPTHFHEHYVIGFVEAGRRTLSCNNRESPIGRGNVILFHPGDPHGCVPKGSETFVYRGLNIPQSVMLDLAGEITGKRELPSFPETIISDGEIGSCLCSLHETVMAGTSGFGKEEQLLLFISALIRHSGQTTPSPLPECRQEVEKACEFIRQNFSKKLYLDQICRHAGLSKSALLRSFTKCKGITPYRYLETVRVNEAKALLRKGLSPAEAAMETGFSDQSHLTNYFTRFIGLAPGVYREIFFEEQRQKGIKNGLGK